MGIQRERRPRKSGATRHCASERGPERDAAWWVRGHPTARDFRTPRGFVRRRAQRDDGCAPKRASANIASAREQRSSLATPSLRRRWRSGAQEELPAVDRARGTRPGATMR